MYNPFSLPDWEIVAGATESKDFELYTMSRTAQDLPGAVCNFSATPYVNETEVPTISKTFSIEACSDGSYHLVSVKLDSDDTKSLRGKYIYQLTIRGDEGDIGIPFHGMLYVARNINPGFLEEA